MRKKRQIWALFCKDFFHTVLELPFLGLYPLVFVIYARSLRRLAGCLARPVFVFRWGGGPARSFCCLVCFLWGNSELLCFPSFVSRVVFAFCTLREDTTGQVFVLQLGVFEVEKTKTHTRREVHRASGMCVHDSHQLECPVRTGRARHMGRCCPVMMWIRRSSCGVAFSLAPYVKSRQLRMLHL